MRIAFVNATKKWGGVKTWMLNFAVGLQDLGHDVYVYARQDHFVDSCQQKNLKAKHFDFGMDLNPIAIYKFYQLFKRNKIDCVFVNVEKGLSTAGIAAKLLAIPVIQRIGLPNDIAYKLKTSLIHKYVDPYFLCPCEFIAKGFKLSLPYLKDEKIKVILNGKTPTVNALKTNSPRHLILTQQLNNDKGHIHILKALEKVKYDFVCHIVGTGSNEKEIKAFAETLDIKQEIIWHGFTTDVASKLKQADIFLLASTSEGLPNTQLEALAHGLLPVMHNVGGVCEVLSEELKSWVLDFPASVEEFTTQIEKALQLSDEELLLLKEEARNSCHTFCEQDKKVLELDAWLKKLKEN